MQTLLNRLTGWGHWLWHFSRLKNSKKSQELHSSLCRSRETEANLPNECAIFPSIISIGEEKRTVIEFTIDKEFSIKYYGGSGEGLVFDGLHIDNPSNSSCFS
jgi:hypothetical protein